MSTPVEKLAHESRMDYVGQGQTRWRWPETLEDDPGTEVWMRRMAAAARREERRELVLLIAATVGLGLLFIAGWVALIRWGAA